MTRCQFSLRLTTQQCEQYYAGHARSVVARADSGLKIAFPARELRPFVTRSGVQGRFEIVFDANKRLVSLSQI